MNKYYILLENIRAARGALADVYGQIVSAGVIGELDIEDCNDLLVSLEKAVDDCNKTINIYVDMKINKINKED